MKKELLHDYFRFGFNFHLLLEGRTKGVIGETVFLIDEFIEFLKEFDLPVTVQASVNEGLIKLREKLNSLDKKSIITETDSEKLADIMTIIRKVLEAELFLRDAYRLTEKRLGLTKLAIHIEELFESGIFQDLPEIVKTDFKEAGQCITFERPTAAAFHILRGTEGMLKSYYYYMITENQLKNPMWDPMIQELIKMNKSPAPLLSVLDNIRINFRNPTMHPESIYNIEEVQSLFNLCSDAVSRIVKEINKNGKKESTHTLE